MQHFIESVGFFFLYDIPIPPVSNSYTFNFVCSVGSNIAKFVLVC